MKGREEQHHTRTYNAITAAYKLMQRRVAETLSEEGLTQPQFHALRIAAKKAGASMREISDGMLVTPANITGIIDRLESRGLILRGAREGDRRATIIGLTPAGRALEERVTAKYEEFIQKALQVLTTDEQRTLSDLLFKFQEGLSQPEDRRGDVR